MSRTIAFLAGLGAGHLEEKDRIRQRSRQDERDQWERDDRAAQGEERAFQKGERTRAVADRDALRTAAAPVPVLDGESFQPAMDDDGNAMPPNPTAGTFKVGAARFAERGLAVDAADQMRRGRVQSELDRQDPVRGDQFRASGAQQQASELTLKKHVGDMLKEGTLDALMASINGASTEEVTSIFNRSGKAKVAQLKVEPFEFNHPTLGKQRSARLSGKLEDGTPIQVDDAFARSLDLFGAAKKLDLMGQWARDKSGRDHQERQDRISQQNANSLEQQRRDAAGHQQRMEGLAREKLAAGAAPPQVTLKDKREFESDLSGYIKDRFPVKDGATQQERDTIAAQANSIRAIGQTIFHTNATLGQPLTGGTVGEAIELALDRKNVRIINVGGAAYEGVMVNGQPVITSQTLERKPPAASAAQALQAVPPAGASAARASQGITSAMPQPAPQVDTPESAAVDAARGALSEASRQMMSFGSRQRAENPAGFMAASRATEAAKAQLVAAERAYQATVQRAASAAFKYASP